MTNYTLVGTMKNEGPFILEWIAYHRLIGFNQIVIGSNDCQDKSDALLDALALEGVISHRRNSPPPGSDPQHVFLKDVEDNWLVNTADWIMVLDADEFLNISAGEGHLTDLLATNPDADAIVILWKSFGDAGIAAWSDALAIEQFTRCEDHIDEWNRYHKTLFRNNGKFKGFGAHYPCLNQDFSRNEIRIFNTNLETYSIDDLDENSNSLFSIQQNTALWTWTNARVNHYPVKSPDLFLMKRHRGDVVPGIAEKKYAQGSSYHWLREKNAASDETIHRFLPKLKEELALLRKSRIIREAEQQMLEAFASLRETVLQKYAGASR